jgi:hypothetical protein
MPIVTRLEEFCAICRIAVLSMIHNSIKSFWKSQVAAYQRFEAFQATIRARLAI